MTFEEAKKIFLNRGYIEVLGGTYYDADKWRESITVISKWLEQQSCEDCISRQAVDELSKELVHTTRDKADFLCNFWEGLQKLPSVTPKEKTGHWKPIEYDGYADGYPVWDVWECSQCGLEHNGDKESLTAFCPDCGCHMIEPQESEDK